MVSFKILGSENGYSVVEPKNTLDKSLGFLMVVNPHNKVLRFYRVSSDGGKEAIDYMKYCSLSRWDKLKYWLNYKRRKD